MLQLLSQRVIFPTKCQITEWSWDMYTTVEIRRFFQYLTAISNCTNMDIWDFLRKSMHLLLQLVSVCELFKENLPFSSQSEKAFKEAYVSLPENTIFNKQITDGKFSRLTY